MSDRTGFFGFSFFLIGAVIWLSCGYLGAKTVEVEEEDEVLAVPTVISKIAPAPFILKEDNKGKAPTPSAFPTAAPPKKSDQTKPLAADKPKAAEIKLTEPEKPVKAEVAVDHSASTEDSSRPRVRIDDNIGFSYFMKSGFMVGEASEISPFGQIVAEKGDLAYSTSKKCRIKLSPAGSGVKVGDQLVVYRTSPERLTEPVSGFSGLWAQNLAVLTVLEKSGSGCLGVVTKSFYDFYDGDMVKDYSEEEARWKQAQVKKPLPANEIRCFVAGGEVGHKYYSHTEFIVLTAGTNQGVVEGLSVQLRSPKLGQEDATKGEPIGLARVFHAGTNYSMAQIIHSALPVEKGFEAYYQP